MADDQKPQDPVSPSGQTTPPADIGQQPERTWPNSTNLANTQSPADSSSTNLVNLPAEADASAKVGDQQATQSAEPVVPEPPKEEIPPPTPSSEIGQVTETQPISPETPPSSEGTWPDSTKMANDIPADSSDFANQTNNPSADSGQVSSSQTPTDTIPADRQESTNLANLTPPTDEPVVSTDLSAEVSAKVDSPSAPVSPVDIQSTSSLSPVSPTLPLSPTDISPSVPTPETSPPSVTQPEPPGVAKPPEEIVDTNVQLPDNQAPQVQSDTPKDTPTIDTEKSPEDLANFKPEPSEQPQEAPLADNNISESANTTPGVAVDDSPGVKEPELTSPSPSISFGDLLSPENQTPSIHSIPPIPSSPPPVSFPPPVSTQPPQSDQSQPVIPPTSFGDLIKDIEITPPSIPEAQRSVEQQQSTQPPQPPLSSQSTQSPTPPPSPVSPQSDLSAEALAKADQLSLRRQKANQVRSQKKENHLNKIMELVQNTKTISNTDIQRLLHVSQSTATNYLAELSQRSLLKRQGIRGGAKYTL